MEIRGYKVFRNDWTCSPGGNTKQYTCPGDFTEDLVPVRLRLGDLENLKQELLWGNVYLSEKEINAFVDAVDNQPIIDPETLLIVQELRNQLAQVTAERDAAITQLHGKCSACKHYSQYHARGKCEKCKWDKVIWNVPMERQDDNWEWRGLQEVQDNE